MLTQLKYFWSSKKNPQELSIFLERNIHSPNLFKNLNVLKLPDKVAKYTINPYPKLLKIDSLLQQLHIHIIPDALTQLALK